jgi:hypothetical protein
LPEARGRSGVHGLADDVDWWSKCFTDMYLLMYPIPQNHCTIFIPEHQDTRTSAIAHYIHRIHPANSVLYINLAQRAIQCPDNGHKAKSSPTTDHPCRAYFPILCLPLSGLLTSQRLLRNLLARSSGVASVISIIRNAAVLAPRKDGTRARAHKTCNDRDQLHIQYIWRVGSDGGPAAENHGH